MKQALDNIPQHDFTQPPSIVTVRIDPKSGNLAYTGQPDAVFEVFRSQFAPTTVAGHQIDSTGTNDSEEDEEGGLF